MSREIAVITGFGKGLSEHLATRLLQQNYLVAGLSRSCIFGNEFKQSNADFHSFACDVSDEGQVRSTLDMIRRDLGQPSLVIHNAALLMRDNFLATFPDDFERLWRVISLGAVNISREVLPDMLEKEKGTLLFTGATASVKAGANSPAFSSAKFALRGLAQSLARSYHPKGIHVIHTIIDGVIWGARAQGFGMAEHNCMDAEHIADQYMTLINQHPTAWTHEIDLRPFKENF